MVAHRSGLAVVGTSLVLSGEIVGAAIAGYILTEFPQSLPIERLAREAGIPFKNFWNLVRKELPLAQQHLVLRAELLQVLGDALLRENYRTRQYEEISAQLRIADTAKDQFLAVLSHELRTPLTVVLGWARLLRTGHLDEAARVRALEIIERNAQAQARLIEDLLDISRIIAGKIQLVEQDLDLGLLVEQTVDNLFPTAESKGIRLDVRLDARAGLVAGDPVRLQQVIFNLVSNAIKFTPRGGEVAIRLAVGDSHAELSVSDTGQGIGPEFLPYVFEAFRQADARRPGGLGLGLAIARHLVEMHRGTIRAESAGEGQGATFLIKLPLAAGVTSPVLLEGRSMRDADSLGANPRPLLLDHTQVLVVEDDPDTRELLGIALQAVGAEVIAVGSVGEALTALDRTWPDVLVSDIGLPDEDGYALIRKVRVRETERGGRIWAVAVTAYASAEDRARAISAGYQAHVPKPVDTAQLINVVADLIRPVCR